MSLSSEAIDRIVANVLNQLSAPAAIVPAPRTAAADAAIPATPITLSQAVVTADLLEALPIQSRVLVRPRAIITPAAQDSIKLRQLQVQRGEARSGDQATASSATGTPTDIKSLVSPPLLIVVRSTQSVERLWEGLAGHWKREWLGCPDDAAKLAIGEIARGGASTVLILTEQTYRAACLANRHEKAKAVAIQDVSEVKVIRKQIRANVWCVDPANRSFFELKNLFQQIQNEPPKS